MGSRAVGDTLCPVEFELNSCYFAAGHSGKHSWENTFIPTMQVPQEKINRIPPMQVPQEKVNHPPHYGGDVEHEHWKCMVAVGLDHDAFVYNCTKYLWRLGRKNGAPVLEDLKKAMWYLQKRIEQEERACQRS